MQIKQLSETGLSPEIEDFLNDLSQAVTKLQSEVEELKEGSCKHPAGKGKGCYYKESKPECNPDKHTWKGGEWLCICSEPETPKTKPETKGICVLHPEWDKCDCPDKLSATELVPDGEKLISNSQSCVL